MGAEFVALAVFIAYFSFIHFIKWWSGRLRLFPALILFSKLWYQKYWFDKKKFSPYKQYFLSYYLYVRTRNLWPIFGLADLNKNLFELIANLLNITSLSCSRFSLSYIWDIVLQNKARFLCSLMWDILRHHFCTAKGIFQITLNLLF